MNSAGRSYLRLPRLLLPVTALLYLPITALADEGKKALSNREVTAVKLATPPVIDGDISDEAWKKAAVASEFTDAYDAAPEPQPTLAWIGYDDQNIYVAFHCKHSDPGSIVARQTRKGASLDQDDTVEFTINPFGTRRGDDESDFVLNAIGTQDADIAGGRANKEEWLGAWQGAAKKTTDGWTAEMAIPWKVLTHPSGGRRLHMDINFNRHIAESDREFQWSNMGPNGRRELGGRWLDVDLPNLPIPNRFSLLGYNFTGREEGGGIFRSGLDARYAATPQLSIVGTLNPDFRNIEGDVEEIDFSYAEQLSDERRPFFLEGGDYFGGGGIFAPQRIPQFDAGLKLYGKMSPGSSIGLLSTYGRGRQDGVFRWREALSPNVSYSLGYVRRDDSEFTNDVWQVDGRNRRGNFNANWSYSRSADLESNGERANTGAWYSDGRFGTGVFANQVSPGYRARNGFVPFNDQRGIGVFAFYEGLSRRGPIRAWEVFARADDSRHYDGSFFTRSRNIGASVRTANDLRLRLSFEHEGFEQFRDRVTTVGFRYPASDSFHNFGLSYSFGRREGEPYRYLAPSFAYRFGQKLTIALSMESVRHVENRDLDVLTVNYDLSRKQSLAARLVRRGAGTNWYASFRQGGYGGLEYFFILGDPNAERFTNRFVIKAISPIAW